MLLSLKLLLLEIPRLLSPCVTTALLFMQVCHFSTNLEAEYILSVCILDRTLHATIVIPFTQIA